MIHDTAINWKENMREYLYNKWKDSMDEDFRNDFRNESMNDTKREDALAMLKEGFSHEVIERITKLPLMEIEKLEAQSV